MMVTGEKSRIRLPRSAARFVRGRVAGFVRDPSGAMAVEFAMVIGPLLFMLFAIMELALVFMVSTTLESATSDTARTIRTGAAQTAGGASAVTIRNSICAKLGWLQAQCQTNLKVDVRTFTQFTNPTVPNPVSGGVFNTGSLVFNMGGPGDIVMVRAFYPWTMITPFLQMGGLQKLNGGQKIVTAAATFRNEPY